MAANRAVYLLHKERLTSYRNRVYLPTAARAEQRLAERIYRLQNSSKPHHYGDLAEDILELEKKLRLTLNEEQKLAVTTAMTAPISIITGGPGTGKTLIQRAFLELYRSKNPSGEIMCCAPTGRAARRMEESTGVSATTIHKALGLIAGEDGNYCEPEQLEADLILVDEVSMMDIYLAGHLLYSIPQGSQLVLIGDVDQLPSVGPGAVLKSLIDCGKSLS